MIGVSAPLAVFVHVPKTAGSFINTELTRWRPGRDHIEAVIDDRAALTKVCGVSSWISGHVPVTKMVHALSSASTRPLRLYTLVREPVAQIASHYNWLIEIHHRGGSFYQGHPQAIKEISEKIRSSDNSNPRIVTDNLRRFAGLFLNQQCRIVLGVDVSGWCDENIRILLRIYDGLLPERRRDDLLKAITAGQIKPQQQAVNRATEHFDRKVFDSDTVRSFLQENHDGDLRLFNLVSQPQPVR